MTNKKILLAILAIALVLGMTACSEGGGGGSSGGKDVDSLTGTTWIGAGGVDQIVFLPGKKVEYTVRAYGITINGTYTVSGNNVNVHYKGSTSGISYDENWVYELSGNSLIVKNATGNPNLVSGGANVGYILYKQN